MARRLFHVARRGQSRVRSAQTQTDRRPIEFLNLRQVSCSGLTLQGTGMVTITVPPSCSAYAGPNPVVVDLGPSLPIDEPAGASALPTTGRTVSVVLDSIARLSAHPRGG